MVYNGDGARVAKTIGAATTDYVLDLASTLPVVISDTDALYLYGLDIIAEQLAGADRYYYVHDGLGSVRQVVDTSGQIATRYAYDPFGVPLAGNGVPNPYQFTGEAWDAGVELLYLRARYYQPETGRFVTKDPWAGDVWRPGTLNRYVYAGNNPVNRIDPTGLQCVGPECDPQPSGVVTPEPTPGGALTGPMATGTPIPSGAAPTGTAGPTPPPQPSPRPTAVLPVGRPRPGAVPAPQTIDLILIALVPHEVLLGRLPDPYVVLPEMMSYAMFGDYSRRASLSLSEVLLLTWFFPIGPEEWSFGPRHSLTKDVMKDPAMKWFKDEWREAGRPLPFSRRHRREGWGETWVTPAIGWAMLVQENYELGMCVLGRGSQTAGGRIDPVGGVIGSFDMIRVEKAGVGVVKFEVHSWMDRSSLSRPPGADEGLLEPVWRSDVNWRTGNWWGTRVHHHFYWYERDPLGVR
jgi:RHS repeat-associated protein